MSVVTEKQSCRSVIMQINEEIRVKEKHSCLFVYQKIYAGYD